jgi:hyaluronan synthase
MKKDVEEQEVLMQEKQDRRLLSYVPDASGIRTNWDRRWQNNEKKNDSFRILTKSAKEGQRYHVDYIVTIYYESDAGEQQCVAYARDISTTGMLLQFQDKVQGQEIVTAPKIRLSFDIVPGSMPEGYEIRINKLPVECVRTFINEEGTFCAGVRFRKTLSEYVAKKRGWYMLGTASFFIFIVSFIVIMMRSESVIYFQFNKYLYLYSIIAATLLLSRYFFGALYRPVPVDMKYTPGVSIVIPCFNEERWIQRTILSCINQDYPPENLEVIVVDDCSNDQSLKKIHETIDQLKSTDKLFNIAERIRYYSQPVNKGKREAMALGAKKAQHQLLVFVDSDSFLDPFAIRNVVQPFKDSKMGGVSGRTDVANTYTNALTKMQSVRYYIAFRIMKAAEGYFDAATCLSGPLSCYRKDLVLTYCDDWLHQTFLGQRATFGDDRSMTNFILRHHRTTYQDTAICSTIVPKTYSVFLRQQMRWKRSWLRESLIAARFMWKKEPFMALFFYMGLLVPIAAPVIVLYNLLYVPIVHRVFPTTFLVGMAMMAMLMSLVQLLLRRSTTWIYGIWFCLYYEAVLLWQMPAAWFTFWKSTWGTRMTPADLAALAKKRRRKDR